MTKTADNHPAGRAPDSERRAALWLHDRVADVAKNGSGEAREVAIYLNTPTAWGGLLDLLALYDNQPLPQGVWSTRDDLVSLLERVTEHHRTHTGIRNRLAHNPRNELRVRLTEGGQTVGEPTGTEALTAVLLRWSGLAEMAGTSLPDLLEPVMEALEVAASDRAETAPAASDQLSVHDRAVLESAGVDVVGAGYTGPDAGLITVVAYQRLLASSWTVPQAAERLSKSASRLRAMVADKTLHSVRHGSQVRLPSWQFVDDRLLDGMAIVGPAISESVHPLAVESFMTKPDPDLVVGTEALSPVIWMRTGGDPEAVATLITHLGAAG